MGRILVVYYSRSGNTEKAAAAVAEGAKSTGKHEVKCVAVGDLDLSEFTAADAFAFGSPDYFSYMAGEMKTFFESALGKVERIKGKPFVSFMTHGGGGSGIESLDRLGSAIGLRKVTDGVAVPGAPDPHAAETLRTLGTHLAEEVG